jgi:hypothetical protein
MNRDEAARAAQELAKSPAAKWIGNKLVGGALIQKCTRCGAEQALEMPGDAMKAFQRGGRGDAVAAHVPPDFDAKLFAWKRDFQRAHEGCVE